MSEPKIIVMKRKSLIISTAAAIIILILLLLIINKPNQNNNSSATANKYNGYVQSNSNKALESSSQSIENKKYTPGVYTYVFSLNDTFLNMEVIVDSNHINAVSITNLDETVTAMYPLISPSLNEINSQLVLDCDINSLALPENSKYTSLLLIDAIKNALDKAAYSE